MTLSKQQKGELDRLSMKLKKLENQLNINNIDLDVFMSDYTENGYEIYATEKISMDPHKRKQIFEQSEKIKSNNTINRT